MGRLSYFCSIGSSGSLDIVSTTSALGLMEATIAILRGSTSHVRSSLHIQDMFVNNPHAQAGWYNPQNPQSINQSPWRPNSSKTLTFGALPNLNETPASVLTFALSFFNPDILNCLVTGPKSRRFFDIRNSNSNAHFHSFLVKQMCSGSALSGKYLAESFCWLVNVSRNVE